jgi:hypothetical protein
MFLVKESLIIPGELGIFADKNFAPGELLFIAFTPNPSGEGSQFFEVAYTQSKFNSSINHSDTPNSETILVKSKGVIYRRTLKPIMRGQEITSDYTQTLAIVAALGYKTKGNWLHFLPQMPTNNHKLPQFTTAIL